MSILDVPPVEMMSEDLKTSTGIPEDLPDPVQDSLRTLIVQTDSDGTSFSCKVRFYSINCTKPAIYQSESITEKATLSLGNVPARAVSAIFLGTYESLIVNLGFANLNITWDNMNDVSCSEDERDSYSVVLDIKNAYFTKSKLDE